MKRYHLIYFALICLGAYCLWLTAHQANEDLRKATAKSQRADKVNAAKNTEAVHDSAVKSSKKLRSSQLEGCRRGNILRAHLNTDSHIIERFMLSAAKGRIDQAKLEVGGQHSLDLKLAHEYMVEAHSLYHPMQVKCKKAYPPTT